MRRPGTGWASGLYDPASGQNYGGQCAGRRGISMWGAAQTEIMKKLVRRADQPRKRPPREGASVVFATYIDRYK